jgi:hypothetical protein
LTTASGMTVVVHAIIGLGMPSTSTTHCRQAPTGSSSGWSQKRGTMMPSCSAARIISVPLGTVISWPSIVSVTSSTSLRHRLRLPGRLEGRHLGVADVP